MHQHQAKLPDGFPTMKAANALAESSIRNMFQIFAVDSLAMPELLTPHHLAGHGSMVGEME